jgi:hypothetical protein
MNDVSVPVSLPPDWAFVVQLQGGTPFDAALLRGRIEHVASGRACTFESLEAMRAFMEQVMLPSPSAEPAP